MPDIFLSYSREDQATARRFAEALTREGFEVWWDQTLSAGEHYDKVTEQALREAKAVVVLWSKHSVDSRWVRSEATIADRNGTLVPVMIEDCTRPVMFELTHTAELARWKGDASDQAWRSFIAGLRRYVDGKAPASGASAKVTAAPEPVVSPLRKPSVRVVAIGLAVLALLSCLYVVVRSMDGIGAAPSAAPISIVVLPFDDISPARDQADLAAGVARTIRDTLSLLPDLAVQEEISSAAVKGDDARTIGRTLNVAYALFGEMYKQGERLRINVRLVRTDNGQLEWPGSDERPFTDILKVQHEIATGVAQALQIKLGVGIGQQQGMTRNVAAYQAYTAAAPLLDGIPEHISKAIDALVRATKEDPTFARAWLGLARARAMMRGAAATPQERQYWSDRADEALDIARDMDADLPEVHQALAARSLYNGDWEEAARQHEKAAAARSSQTGRRVPIVLGSRFLLAVGRIKEAIQGLEERRALDRLNPGLANDLAGAYAADGNMDAAFKEWERASELEGMQAVVRSSALMGALSTGDPARIEHWIQAVSEESEGGPDKAVLYRSWLDLKSEALPKLHEFIEDPESFDASRGVAIAFMAHLGYNEAALQVVRSSANRGAVGGLWHPVYREMRKLNGFKQLLLDWRLVDYWRETDNWGEFCRFTTGDDFECH